jgi:hypothetical protein
MVSCQEPSPLKRSKHSWCGARLGGSKSNAFNLILRLLLYHFLHMMRYDAHQCGVRSNADNLI